MLGGHELTAGQRVRTTPQALSSRRSGTHCTGTVARAPQHGRTVSVLIDGREVASRWPASFWTPLEDGESVTPPAEVAEPVYATRRRPKPTRHALTVDQVAELVCEVLRGTAGLRCVKIVRALERRVPFARSRISSALRGRPALFEKIGAGATAVWKLKDAATS